ncbi:MAG: 1-deoxy-D-xylulose-5-phosphate reductoisomerase [Verrucomicrobiota bacterium]|nr:MAG: 1-deoxy-D-xylulose-5-phosphate reductoisomerase [Verrucomicrobiota bacterium]
MKKKRIVILGATGSVGQTVLREIAAHREFFEVVGIACQRNVIRAQELLLELNISALAITDETIHITSNRKIYRGSMGLTAMVTELDFDVLVVAISGIDGLKPTLRAIDRGKDIILASKEILVEAGDLVMQRARERGVQILPLDSEHNAIFQCTRGETGEIQKLQLTASGGRFWNLPVSEMEAATPEIVLNHPKWSMGAKITVDSSTMANKGLEIIEAMHLFQVRAEQIEVLVHPECVVHSLVEFVDGNTLAQLSPTSIAYAARACLFFPERGIAPQSEKLDLALLGSLHFYAPDLKKFPCLRLAYEVARRKQSLHIAYNAANEVAVELFLAHKIPFLSIPQILEAVLEKIDDRTYTTLEEILAVDQMVRSQACQVARRFAF